jgi:hypothetical protein
MATKKTWILVIVGLIGACVVALVVVAGAGVYFVTRHINTRRAGTSDAMTSLDKARARFKDQRPLIEVDAMGRPSVSTPLTEMPPGSTQPNDLIVLAWNPDDERVVTVTLPFWLLRFGHRKIDLMNGDKDFDLDRLNLDVDQLQRIGPKLVFDWRRPTGERVLIWTQ